MKSPQPLNDRLEEEQKMQTLRNEHLAVTEAGWRGYQPPGSIRFSDARLSITKPIDPPISNYEQRLTGEVASLRQQLKKSEFLTLLFGGVIGLHALIWVGILGVSVFKFLTQ